MVKYYINNAAGKGIEETDALKKNCWIHMEAPSAEEIESVAALTGLPDFFLKAALDEEEVAHLDVEDDARLVVIDIPKMVEKEEETEIFTIPLAIIQNADYFVTVCTMTTTVLNDFFEGKVKNIDTARHNKIVYQLMYNNSSRFLYYLRQIDKTSNRIQKSLSRSMQNKELLQLLDLQKSLVFFSASLTANFSVTQKISNNNLAKAPEDERDIIEDVVIENRQALEMCSVYREIIKSTMDAFASVVNNNQNIVMKFLTAVTIILSIPMVIAGFWGMNTTVPFEGKLWGFWVTVGISLIVSVVISVIMARKRMF